MICDALSLQLGKEGKVYKLKHLELLKSLMSRLGLPFVSQMNSSTFIDALRVCPEEDPEVQKKVEEIVITAAQIINFEDKIMLDNFRELAENLVPGLLSKTRPPKTEFEAIVSQAIKILHTCKYLKQLLSSDDLSREQEEQVVELLTKIEAFKSRPNLFKDNFKPIECEYIADLLHEICELEDYFLKVSKKVQKSFELILQRGNSSQVIKQVQSGREEVELHNRTRFVEGEQLAADESNTIEYKNYSYPFNGILKKVLQKTICSFLNSKGGRLYIGVRDDDKSVCGLTLTCKDRDCLRLEIANLLDYFYPNITHEDFVRVDFIQVHSRENKPIPGRVVAKIIVRQGDLEEIYSTSREALKCYIRKDGFCKNLDSGQIVSVIKKKLKQVVDSGINPKEFDDPKPEKLEEILFVSASKKNHKEHREKKKMDFNYRNSESDEKKCSQNEKNKEKKQEEKLGDQNALRLEQTDSKKDQNPKKDEKKLYDKKVFKEDKKVESSPAKAQQEERKSISKNEKSELEDVADIPLKKRISHNTKIDEFLQGLQPKVSTEENSKRLKKSKNNKKAQLEQDSKAAKKDADFATLESLIKNVLTTNVEKDKAVLQNERGADKKKESLNMKEQDNFYHFKVTGLPLKLNDEEVKCLFKDYKIVDVPNIYRDGPKHDGDCKGFAKVKFSDLESGKLAIFYFLMELNIGIKAMEYLNSGIKIRENEIKMIQLKK